MFNRSTFNGSPPLCPRPFAILITDYHSSLLPTHALTACHPPRSLLPNHISNSVGVPHAPYILSFCSSAARRPTRTVSPETSVPDEFCAWRTHCAAPPKNKRPAVPHVGVFGSYPDRATRAMQGAACGCAAARSSAHAAHQASGRGISCDSAQKKPTATPVRRL